MREIQRDLNEQLAYPLYKPSVSEKALLTLTRNTIQTHTQHTQAIKSVMITANPKMLWKTHPYIIYCEKNINVIVNGGKVYL